MVCAIVVRITLDRGYRVTEPRWLTFEHAERVSHDYLGPECNIIFRLQPIRRGWRVLRELMDTGGFALRLLDADSTRPME